MSAGIELLDCTLRDGAYITASNFGTVAIRGIISHLEGAGTEIIECGWLKDTPHTEGSSFYHVPSDIEMYMSKKRDSTSYVVMIDWDRYDVSNLPENDGNSIDAVRVVFPKGKHNEAIKIGLAIRKKGYRLFFQAANTFGYSDDELDAMADAMNEAMPESLSIVDTFGAMYEEDLERIALRLDERLDKNIKLGFHSHNNKQLSFALSMHFVNIMEKSNRAVIVDSSLCGMGRGAGNTTTELMASFLNEKKGKSYDLDCILDAIDVFMEYFKKSYSWGYSTPYFISGIYCTHVNNIAYLLDKHRSNARDMRNIIESLPPDKRLVYDYDLLEEKYLDYYKSDADHAGAIKKLKEIIGDRSVLMLCSGASLKRQRDDVLAYIKDKNPIVIGINAMRDDYKYDICFFSNQVRFSYMEMQSSDESVTLVISSNIRNVARENELIVDFNSLVKRGWKYFDNAGIMCLRLLRDAGIGHVAIAGFDGFSHDFSKNYADCRMPSVNSDDDWDVVNREIKEMLEEFEEMEDRRINIESITRSIFF